MRQNSAIIEGMTRGEDMKKLTKKQQQVLITLYEQCEKGHEWGIIPGCGYYADVLMRSGYITRMSEIQNLHAYRITEAGRDYLAAPDTPKAEAQDAKAAAVEFGIGDKVVI